jgi:undecaprenyl-diphosphatase
MEIIQNIDNWFLLLINSHHSPFMDRVMWFASGSDSWIPLYVIIAILIVITYKEKSWLILLLIVAMITVSDQLSSSVIKPLFHRLRPSHEPGLENILRYVKNYRGGMYGFVSSHASNFFAGATFLILTVSKRIRWLPIIIVPVVGLVIYSRVYLGVHYPTDILVGGLLGFVLGKLTASIYKRLNPEPETFGEEL